MNTARSLMMIAMLLGSAELSARHLYHCHTPFQTQHQGASQSSRFLTIHGYTSIYSRSAHDAFNHHGISRQPLSALYFGKSDFRMSEMFENCYVPQNTEHYNPFLRIAKMHPRVHYNETGSHLGFTAAADSSDKRWRCGARIDIPVIRREVARKDHGSRGPAQTQNLINERPYRINQDDGTNYRIDRSYAYRLDFLEALSKNVHNDSAVDYSGNQIQIFNRTVPATSIDDSDLGAAIIYSPEGHVPRGANAGTTQSKGSKKIMPDDFVIHDHSATYYIPRASSADATNYTQRAEAANKTPSERREDQDRKATLWVIPTYNTADADSLVMSTNSESIQTSMSDALRDHNANELEWLHDHGFHLESDQVVGLGDITIELFGSYIYNKQHTINYSAGLTLPTAAGSTQSSAPYHIHLGHRNHAVVFTGIGFDTQLSSHFVTLDGNARLSFALPAHESRCAMPQGANIKNLGVLTDATTSWRFFDGNIWLHIHHPLSSDIRCSVGYTLYWKSDDSLTFNSDTLESILGKQYDVTRDVDGDVIAGTQAYTAQNIFTPDTGVSIAKSESIAHSLCCRLGYHVSEWLQLHAGGSYTIAGKNAPQTIEGSVGCVVAF